VGHGSVLAGRYRLEERVRTRPDGSTWRAVDETLERGVLVEAFAVGPQKGAEIVDAARRAALVEDVRLQRILAAGEERGMSYVVLERVPARTLADLVGSGPLPPEIARRIVGEAAEALDRAASRGLHHLRLRPTSLIVGRDGHVTVTGTAIDAASEGEEPSSDTAARRSDAVGLVALLYAALTGRWPGPQDAGLPRAPRVAGRPVAPGDLVAGVPNDLDTLCVVTLGPHDDGPRSPRDLARQLAPWASAGPLTDPRGPQFAAARPQLPRAPGPQARTPTSPPAGGSAADSTETPPRRTPPWGLRVARLRPGVVDLRTAQASNPETAARTEIDVSEEGEPAAARSAARAAERAAASGIGTSGISASRIGASGRATVEELRRSLRRGAHAPPGRVPATDVPLSATPPPGGAPLAWSTPPTGSPTAASPPRGGLRGTSPGSLARLAKASSAPAPAPPATPPAAPAPSGSTALSPTPGPDPTPAGPSSATSRRVADAPSRSPGLPAAELRSQPAREHGTEPGPDPSTKASPQAPSEAAPDNRIQPAAEHEGAAGQKERPDPSRSLESPRRRRRRRARGRSHRAETLRSDAQTEVLPAVPAEKDSAPRSDAPPARRHAEPRPGAARGEKARPAALDRGERARPSGAAHAAEHRAGDGWRPRPQPPGNAVSGVEALDILGAVAHPAEPVAPFGPATPLTRPPREQSRLVLAVLAVLVLVLGLFAVSRLTRFDAAPLITTGSPARLPSPTGAGPASSGSASRNSPASPSPSGTVSVAGAAAIDPQGDGNENGDLAKNAVDGDPSTSWHSERYDSPDFGGIKKGVGLVLDLGDTSKVTTATVNAPGTDGTVELRASDTSQYEGSQVIATANLTGSGKVTLTPPRPVTARYLVLWFTRAPENGGERRVVVNEVDVR
jgi:F5/8 type C domain